MAELAILVPVLERPRRVEPFLRSVQASTPAASVLFICDPFDHAEQNAIGFAATNLGFSAVRAVIHGGSYAQKINAAVRATTEPYVLLAADDVEPHPGWFGAALAQVRNGATVVGLNDLIPRPRRPEHATHFLLTRDAAEQRCIDGSPGPLCEDYAHWRIDDELIATATKRGHYAYARDAIVEHVDHPMTGGADDATYAKGRASARRDNKVFQRRTRLWV